MVMMRVTYPPKIMARIDADLERLAAEVGLDLAGTDLGDQRQRDAVARQIYLRKWRPGTSIHEAFLTRQEGVPLPESSGPEDHSARVARAAARRARARVAIVRATRTR